MSSEVPAALVRRPKRYRLALARTICRRLIEGESLLAICADVAMPCYSTVMVWLDVHPAFRESYGRARSLQAHALVDEMLGVLRDEALPSADKQARLKGLIWLAARLHPVKYGERATAEGGDVAPSLVVVLQNDKRGDAGTERP